MFRLLLPKFLFSLITICVLLSSEVSIAQTQLEIDISDDLLQVQGELETTFTNDSNQSLDALFLWLPFNRLAQPPEDLDQRNTHWIYPRAFNPGNIQIRSIHVGGREIPVSSLTFPSDQGDEQRILASLPLPESLAPGASVTVEIEFTTNVPRRFGRLGRARRVLTLAGGFYPQIAAINESGWLLNGPFVPQDWNVSVTAPEGLQIVVNEEFFRASQNVRTFQLRPAPYVALIASRRFHRFALEVSGVNIELLSMSSRYRPPSPPTGPRNGIVPTDLPDATRWDYQGRMLATIRNTVRVLEELGLPLPRHTMVRFIEVPLRLEMVSHIPSGALISERTYRVTPFEQFFRFHDLQVARAVGWFAFEQTVARESLHDRAWVLDLFASAISDAFAVSEHGGRGPGLRRLLRIGAFIPEIDQLLYSPLIEFRHLFLRPFRDEDPVRDEPWRLATTWPRGAVIHDKLVDLLGSDAVSNLLQAYPATDTTFRQLLDQEAEEEMDWFFTQWFGPYPSVNYRLADQTSVPIEGGRFRHTIVIERQGDEIREPIEVRLILNDGQRLERRWDGRGQRGEITIESEALLSRVEIDPRRRLLEDASLIDENPSFDNISPPRWRPPVFNGLMFYLSASEANLYALVDFGLKRQYDVRNEFRLRLEYDPRGLSADLFYQRGLGRLLDLNRSSWTLLSGISVMRTFGDLRDNDDPNATIFGASVSVYRDNRWYRYNPMEGWGVRFTASGSGSVDDEGEWGWSVKTSARIAGHWTPRVGHTFTGYLGAGIIFGEPETEQLQSISDRFMLRAFEVDETLGRARLYGGIEYRWTMVHDMNVSLAQIAWWRAIFLAVFVAGGSVSSEKSFRGMFSEDRIFTEVGGGIRLLLDIAGVQPYIISVDVAFPITPLERSTREVNGQDYPRNPVGVYFSIQHTI